MDREKRAQEIAERMKAFLKQNPEINKALQAFNISQDKYQKILEGESPGYYSSSTSYNPDHLVNSSEAY